MLNKTALGENIKRYRSFKGYKQEHFADKVGVSRITLSKIENGRSDVTLSVIITIAKELGVSIDLLLAGRIE